MKSIGLVVLAACLFWTAALAQSSLAPARFFLAAVNDPARPARDRFRDDRRKPAETMAFAGVVPGAKIAELIPGNGYYTRLLAKAVGPTGRIYTLPFGEPRIGASRALALDPAYGNITLIAASPARLGLPEQVDMVWTTQNYHDIRSGRGMLNIAVYAALKPGGTYFVLDHAAKPGAGDEVLLSLHRIDENTVTREIEAAGFVLEAKSDLLRNPSDDRTKMVFDRDLNRNTDQFLLRFRKPG